MPETEVIKRFTDEYPREVQFEAEKVEFTDILEKDIILVDIATMIGNYGEFLVVLGEMEGKRIQFITGSHVIVPKLKRAKEDRKLPLIAKFIQVESDKGKKYYDIN